MRVCIIGLGNFGTQLARHLARDGHEVLAVDNDPAHTDAMKDEIEFVVTANCADIDALADIPAAECDHVIVAIGEDFEASLSIVANLQQIGCKHIICRVINPLHARLLKLLKVDDYLVPEAMAAAWLARRFKAPELIDSFSIGGGHEIVEINLPAHLAGKTLQEANLRGVFGVNLVTVMKGRGAISVTSMSRPVSQVLGVPAPDRKFEEDDILVLFGKERDIRNLIHGTPPGS
jgi:trk system potassium uptake protein TrkA